ncbi:MAG: hypothetical protein U0836_20865 [Pirellulales bacterium]
MWRRVAWLVGLQTLCVLGVLVWETRATAEEPEGLAAVKALAAAADKGPKQVAELIASDRERYLPALVAAVELGPSGLPDAARPEKKIGARSRVLAEALARQGEVSLPVLLPRFARGYTRSELQDVIDRWPPAMITSVANLLSAGDPAQRAGAEQVLIFLAARPAHGQGVVEAVLARPAREMESLEARLPALDWSTHLEYGPRPLAPPPVDQAFLVRLIGHARPQIARWAINSLASLGQTAKPAASALRQWLAPRLAAWDGETTRSAPWQQNEPTIAGYRQHIPHSDPVPWKMFAASEGDLIHDAVVAIYCLDPDSPETQAAIRQTARAVRSPLYAELWLTRLGLAKDTLAIELLIEELEHPDPVCRQTAAVALGRIGAPAAAAKTPLQGAIDASRAGRRAFHHDRHRRRWALDPAARAPENDEEALAAIAQVRGTVFRPDEELKFRQAAEAALRSLDGQSVDFELWVDASAARSVDTIPSWLINRERPEFTFERVQRQLAHWSVETRRQAIHQVQALAPDKASAAAALLQQLVAAEIETDSWFRHQLVEGLGRLGPDAKAALPRLLEIVASPEEDEFVRRQAVDAAARIAPDDPLVIDALVQVLEGWSQKHSTGIYTAVAAKLGDLPAARGKAEKALQRLLQDQFEMNRQVAIHALGKLAKSEMPAETPELPARLRKWGERSAAERTALLLGLAEIVEDARIDARLHYSTEPLPRAAQPVAWLPDLLAAYQQSPGMDEKRQVLSLIGQIGPESTPEFVGAILEAQAYSMLPSLHVSDRSSLPLLIDARRELRSRPPVSWTDERDLLLGIARYGADARVVAVELLPDLDPERLRASDVPSELFDAGLTVLAAAGPETPGVYAALFKLSDHPWPKPSTAEPLVGGTSKTFTTASMSRVVQILGELGPPAEGSLERAKLLSLVDKQLREQSAVPVTLASKAVQSLAAALTDQERRHLVEPLLEVLAEDQPSGGPGQGSYTWFDTRRSAAKALAALGQAASGALPKLDAMAAEDPTVLREARSYGDSLRRHLAREIGEAAEKIRHAGAPAK